ncbi:MAG: peptidoglycan-binding protein [Rhodobacteraceae bacterium]|nr:peptidoglycan-binding protein [Paracoccaceae bacterium]
MFVRRSITAVIAASLIVLPVKRAQADDAMALIGGLIIGGVIAHEVTKNNYRKQTAARQAAASQQARASQATRTTTKSSANSAERKANAQVQTALNYFDYDVGTVDGILGRKSRAGIAQFQSDMRLDVDGTLNESERKFLLNAYQRADAAATVAPYNQILVEQGRKGLLLAFRREASGLPPVPGASTTAAAQTASGSEAQLPNFGVTAASNDNGVAAFCDEIARKTAANGGAVAPGAAGDAELALGEQFCLARSHAIGDTAELESAIPDLTPAQVEQECSGIAPIMKPYVDELTVETPRRILGEISSALEQDGETTEELRVAGRVCLGAGYRGGDAEMALGSALLITAMGERGYAELVSHHLREGFGTDKANGATYVPWMEMALAQPEITEALGQDATRKAVLQQAIDG